eukprot:m.116666 g.116666  ORF g.116666 m.116666 type:complete len:50 (-) comp13151_c1_seq2:6610-6759(-)
MKSVESGRFPDVPRTSAPHGHLVELYLAQAHGSTLFKPPIYTNFQLTLL